MSLHEKIALFVDADNAPADRIEFILSELATYGSVSIRRAYGNWTKDSLKPWRDILHEYAVQPIQQFDLTKQKNASDIALAIDVMDVLYTKAVDVICLVSSDSDFTPVATRAIAEGKRVLGFGERKTPEPFVNACSSFLFLDKPKNIPEQNSNPEKSKAQQLKSDTRLIKLLRQAITAVEDENGWARLGPIGSHIKNHTSFDQRNYGYQKLSDLIKDIDLFNIKRDKGKSYVVQDKRRNKT
ncbi:NYN domain-containing protein [Bacterioplanoides sp.]|uniref:NYN domain-containing protein n=1 Tax=Bacterioplanoides sp. TaxID=2066072 RepID=UPI003B000573